MEAREVLYDFLRSQDVLVKEDASLKNVEDIIEAYYDQFEEKHLRALVERALAEREGASSDVLLGTWGKVIDAVKLTTEVRTDRARTLLAQLVAEGLEGDQKTVLRLVSTWMSQGHIDRIFKSMMQDTIETSKSMNRLECAALLDFASSCVVALERRRADKIDTAVKGHYPYPYPYPHPYP